MRFKIVETPALRIQFSGLHSTKDNFYFLELSPIQKTMEKTKNPCSVNAWKILEQTKTSLEKRSSPAAWILSRDFIVMGSVRWGQKTMVVMLFAAS